MQLLLKNKFDNNLPRVECDLIRYQSTLEVEMKIVNAYQLLSDGKYIQFDVDWTSAHTRTEWKSDDGWEWAIFSDSLCLIQWAFHGISVTF